MLTIEQIKQKYNNGEKITIAIIGDSTSSGFGANPSPNTWINGLSYGCVNNPSFGENWNNDNPYYINTTSIISQAQQDNIGIPSAVRLFRTELESKNQSSKVYNFGGSGYTADTHIANGTVASALALSPDAIFFNLGINTAKNNGSQNTSLRTLVAQAISGGVLPVLVKPHNIGVAYSPSGNWSETATPDEWYPMDNWQSIRDNIQQIANDYNLSVIDLGTDTGELDITLLYDPFHPSNLGYKKISEIYKKWISGDNFIFIKNGKSYTSENNSAFKIKLSDNQIVGIPLTTEIEDFIKIKVGNNIATFK